MEQTEKKKAERYLVVLRNELPVTIWATNFSEVLDELEERAELDGIVVRDDEDIISITKLDYQEG